MLAFDWMGKDKAVKNREPGIEDAYMLDTFNEILQEL